MFMLLSLHLIGIEKWCNYNPETKIMQCNYETKSVCEAYTEGNEVCRLNPNYKDK